MVERKNKINITILHHIARYMYGRAISHAKSSERWLFLVLYGWAKLSDTALFSKVLC